MTGASEYPGVSAAAGVYTSASIGAEAYTAASAGTATYAGTSAASAARTYFNSGLYFMNENSSVLFSLKNAENKAKRDYLKYARSVEDMDTAGFTVKIGGNEFFKRYDNYTEMLMVKQKKLLPEQMKHAWEMASFNYDITRNSMAAVLRDIYMGLLSASDSWTLENEEFKLAQLVIEQEKTRFRNGLISTLQMQEAEYDSLKARKELDAAKRDLENMTRSYNAYIGVDIFREYGQLLYSETFPPEPFEDVDMYVQKALADRFEVVNIKKQLELLRLQLEVLETNTVHEIYTAARKEYSDTLHSINTYEVNLQKTCLEIEKEIKEAYVDIVNEMKSVETMSEMSVLQEDNFEKMKKRYELGLISINQLTQSEIAFRRYEGSFRMAVYSLNTKLLKFEHACGIGPGYQ